LDQPPNYFHGIFRQLWIFIRGPQEIQKIFLSGKRYLMCVFILSIIGVARDIDYGALVGIPFTSHKLEE
jgi:hypothetical protein